MTAPAPEARQQVSRHAAWAMAIGGMIGGGIYALVGVAAALAGPYAWVSILVGGLVAFATVYSYATLVPLTSPGVPVSLFARGGHRVAARVLAWLLVVVYILATSVYTYAAGHYIGHALGLGQTMIAVLEVVLVAAFVGLNLTSVQESARVQTIMVWAQLVVLALLAIGGFLSEPVEVSAKPPSIVAIVQCAAVCFVAFEGFEMLAYDLRELRRPLLVMRRTLPLAVAVVAAIYIAVAIGATRLTGAAVLAREESNALAVAGRSLAGTLGFYIISISAAVAAVTAINATLFSASRLARSLAEERVLPAICARCNPADAPVWSIVALGAGGAALAVTAQLETLAGAASLGFLLLFAIVNTVAFRRRRDWRRWIAFVAFAGTLGLTVTEILRATL